MKLRLSPDVRALNAQQGATLDIADRRARVPRAGRDERVGLTALLRKGWSTESPDCIRYRLYQGWGDRLDTGLQPDLAQACRKARQLAAERGGNG